MSSVASLILDTDADRLVREVEASLVTDTVVRSVLDRAAQREITLDEAQRSLLDDVAHGLGAALGEPTPDLGATRHTGYFVHGPAGRGKTWLLSTVFDAVPVPATAKRRVHFHTFFQKLQRRLGAQMSARTAIDQTVAELLDGVQVFLFDELHVHDPGAAALLNRLLDELSTRGTPTLVTSNYAPEELLPSPVFHHVMEPGIRILRERFTVRALDGGADYRRAAVATPATGFASGRWVAAADLDAGARRADLVLPDPEEAAYVLKDHHALKASAVRGSQVWFDFANLLEAPSVPEDYLELADQFTSWVLTGVPPLSRASRAARARFVMLLDVLVDRDLELTVLARVTRDELVDVPGVPADLFRAESRLALLNEG